MQKLKKTETFLYPPNKKFYWDWFAESPIELILIALTLIAFFFFPKDGCSISKYPSKIKENQVIRKPVQRKFQGKI